MLPTTTTTTTKRKRAYEQRVAEEGSVAVLMIKRGEIDYVAFKPGEVIHRSVGKFAHSAVLGQPMGSVWRGEATTGPKNPTLVPLPATPELWTRALSHRTQVLYHPDIALIVFHLDLKPGSVVVESGTGSGSLTFALARTVAPTGRVLTFDFNSARVQAAREDFALLRTDDICTPALADAATEEGFGVHGEADAVFFDLPKPWLAVGNAVKALKPHACTRLASFSPCIEQVSRMCEALKAAGFVQLRTFECVNRELEGYVYGRALEPPPPMWDQSDGRRSSSVRPSFAPSEAARTCYVPAMNAHSGYLTFATHFPLGNNSAQL